MLDTENSNYSKERFQKQRRKLLIVSLFLILYIFLDLQLRQIKILGNQFNVYNHDYVEIVLWIIFAYFVISYVQYFFIIDKSDAKNHFNYFNDKIIRYILKRDIKKKESIDLNLSQISILKFFPKYIKFNVHSSKYDLPSLGGDEVVTHEITDYRIKISKMLSFLQLSIQTPYFTEYILPFVMISCTLIIKLIF